MDPPTLLSDLCSVCHLSAPKYKCPRCTTRTCSLECSKRHKIRAQCSGIRDQAAFITKGQLFTAEAIDHDFNFLSSIERKVTEADGHGNVVSEKVRMPRRSKKWRNVAFWNAVRNANVHVHRAPSGISREKENKSRLLQRSGQLIWTLEWLFEDDLRCLIQLPDTDTVDHAHKIALRALKHQKIDRERESSASDNDQMTENDTKRQGGLDDADGKDENSLAPKQHLTPQPISAVDTADNLVDSQPRFLSESGEFTHLGSGPQSPESRNQYIYLIRPMTRGSQRVLIPINSDTKLRDALMNQEVMEFPSFQILSQPPDSISGPFILEHEYLEKFNIQQEEMKKLVASENYSFSNKQPCVEDQSISMSHRMSNADDVLAILQRDIQGV